MQSPRSTFRRQRAAFIFVGMFLLLSLLASACGSTSTGSGNTGSTPSGKPTVAPPTGLITPGVLTVGSDTTYPPQEFIDTATNKPTGFDIDLITAMAERMGLKTSIVTAKFDSIIGSLQAKRFDVVISAITINEERKQKVDFVPYINVGSSLLVQTGNPKKLTKVSDLCGLEVGVQNGTVQQDDLKMASDECTKAGKQPIKVTVLQDQTAVIQLLATNRVVATYQDSSVTDYYNKQNPGKFEVGGSVVNAAPEGIAVRKGDTAMLNAVQKAFDAVKADGTYRSLIEKWGLNSGAIAAQDRRTFYA